jgi:acyl-[acyl-carrier-protein]-phospholipid O-acyltransferase/long-chain-fatty-acid--[acyl-carrier-protein] ligase
LPSTRLKTIDDSTEQDLPAGREGLVCVKGPQIMMRYLDQPAATAQVLRDGWYCTGDLGYVDEDGFLKITDRLSRFAKIGGEMVPHQSVEAALLATGLIDEGTFVATSIPDPKRGERLVVVHTPLKVLPSEIYQRLVQQNVHRLWIPSADDFAEVNELPILGTGKLDLRAVRRIAQAESSSRSRAEPVT